jgi:hypothetical protein
VWAWDFITGGFLSGCRVHVGLFLIATLLIELAPMRDRQQALVSETGIDEHEHGGS